MLISIVVLGFNNFEKYTKPCLDSIRYAIDSSSAFEMILVDNASTDSSQSASYDYCHLYQDIKFHQSETNLGFAGGMNLGVSFSKGEWVLLVNNDTLFPKSSLNRLQDILLCMDNAVGILGFITNAAGNEQKFNMDGYTIEQMMLFGEELIRNSTGFLIDVYRTDFFCVAIRKKMWDNLNGLDISFGLGYYEDFDFSLRARQAGWRQVITEDIFIVHVGSASFSVNLNLQKKIIKLNKLKLKNKYPFVKFRHQRDGNLEILYYYQQLLLSGEIIDFPILLRLKRRILELKTNQPRSYIKKILWNLKLMKISYLLSKVRH